MMTKNRVHVFGGGTIAHVRPHLALCAPAYGTVAHDIDRCLRHLYDIGAEMHLTRMAGGDLETNEDVARRLDEIIAKPETKIVFMAAALCDYSGYVLEAGRKTFSGKDQPRLKTRDGQQTLLLMPQDKVIKRIRKERKDIFLVGFKTTAGATADDQYLAGLDLLKKNSCNLVLANDLHTRLNMVITPEQSRYHEGADRQKALLGLVDMAMLRSQLTFTRSMVVPGDAVPWNSDQVPEALRTVVDHCIARGAYKPFNGATVGHFAFKVDDKRFITSKRKVNFNELAEVGMVLVESEDRDTVIAHGAKPSVGGMSQRIIFSEHPGLDCIVHFHCPLRPDAPEVIPVREQRPFECGSHECGRNTSEGLAPFEAGVKAVMLDQHGPNIVFSRNADPQAVIGFIERNFDLAGRTDNVGAAAAV